MELMKYTDHYDAASQVYIYTLKSGPKNVAMIELFLQGKTIAEVSDELDLPYTTCSWCRSNFSSLINSYKEQGFLLLPH